MIDWRLAERIAGLVAPSSDAPRARLDAVATEVAAFAPRSALLVGEYTGLDAGPSLPDPETIDRAAWTQANLRSMQTVLDPVVARTGGELGKLGAPMRLVAGGVLAAEVGALSGFLAGKVLGQYEFPILDPAAPARLLFVAPNLLRAIAALGADETALLRWVALHETTHALQFGGVPWLRGHMAEKVTELLSMAEIKVEGGSRLPKLSGAGDVKALVEAARRDGIVTLFAGPERKAALDQLQATMALIEGHAEHVMDAVGERELDDLAGLRRGLQARRQDRPPLLRLLERLIGFDLKLRQYEQGKAFCDAVVARAGVEGLNVAFSEPAALPTLAELDAPVAWLSRT